MTKAEEAMKTLYDISNFIDYYSSGEEAVENNIQPDVAEANDELFGALKFVEHQLKLLGQYDET